MFDVIVYKYVKMNITHPFREGNSRTNRIWLNLFLKKPKKCVDWETIDKYAYLSAMKISVVNTWNQPFLQSALIDKIDDREVFMKGIDKSYLYEDLYDIPIGEI